MASPLAIAAVTAALKDLLNDGLLNHDLSPVGSISVTAVPPDRVVTGQTEPNQLNLFLYQVTPNLGWRNAGLPTRDRSGVRLTANPLALDLHYLLTAYGSQDLNAEILLGYAMHLLHETPVLTRAQLRTVLGAPSPVDGTILPGPFGNLSAVDLADQIELIKLSPVYLSTEDLSKLWTAMQARYRPTMGYIASVVLIEPSNLGRAAQPVLRRGANDSGPVAVAAPFPTLASVRPEASELLPAMRLGDDLLVTGTSFDDPATTTAVFEDIVSGDVHELVPIPVQLPTSIRLHLPSIAEDANAMADWSIGLYRLMLRVTQPNVPAWTTNNLSIALSPIITVTPLNAAPGDVNLTVTCTPRLRPEQFAHASLLFGSRAVAPTNINNPGDPTQPTTLDFTVPAVAAGEYMVRLRVSGIDSVPAIISGTPPVFNIDPNQRVTVA